MMDTVLEFYEQLAADYHLIFADWRASVRRHGEILDRVIRSTLGAAPLLVLDCSCGIGTQAIGLALRGYRVHATDLGPSAVERARREAQSFGVPVTFDVADMRDLATVVPGSFGVVLACDNSLPHLLSDDDLLRAARAAREKLEAGGLFLASIRDYDQASVERPRATAPQVFDGPDGRRIVFQVWDWSADGRSYALQLFIVRQVAGAWQTSQRSTVYRALLRSELTAILGRAGFSGVAWHLPSETGYYQPIVTARRP